MDPSTRFPKNAFTEHNFFQLESREPDRAVYRLEIRPESCNPYGIVHGGALYTLADDAAGTAVHTDGGYYVTQSGNLHFLDNRAQGVIRAIGQVRRRGRTTVLAEVDIVDQQDALLATGEFVYFRVDPRRMAQRAQETQEEARTAAKKEEEL